MCVVTVPVIMEATCWLFPSPVVQGELIVAVATLGTRLSTACEIMLALFKEGSIRLTQRRNVESGLIISMLECLSACWRAHSRQVV